MSGKLCNGFALANAGAGRLSSSKAYCEGMQYRFGGTLLERPVADDPHESGSPDSDSWQAGWAAVNADAGGPIDTASGLKCCAVPTGNVPV